MSTFVSDPFTGLHGTEDVKLKKLVPCAKKLRLICLVWVAAVILLLLLFLFLLLKSVAFKSFRFSHVCLTFETIIVLEAFLLPCLLYVHPFCYL